MKMTALATLTLLLFSSLAFARPEVIFPADVEVSKASSVRVLEVAELKEFSAEAFAEVSQMIFWESSAAPAGSTVLSRAEISKKLRDLVDTSSVLRKANPAFKIPEQVRLQFSPTGVSRSSVERGLKNILLAKCPTCEYKLKISSVPVLRGTSWSVDYDQSIKNGAFMLAVQENDSAAKQWISGSVKVKNKVPVLKKLLRVGERLQAEDIELTEADITFLRERTPEISEVVGSLANRTLQAGMPIVASDFKKEPAARRGQILKAMVGSDSFEVSINVTAEESGFVGDTIKIQNPETHKMMSAVILEKGVVKVQ
jgi:flagella basal body P-ring formation protein FlgA